MPDPQGETCWLDQLQNHCLTRGELIACFSDSAEYAQKTPGTRPPGCAPT